MDPSDIVPNMTVVGIAVTVISFLAYVFAPNPLFLGFFALGIVLMVVGYTLVIYLNKKTEEAIEAKQLELDERGYIMPLDESYVPYQDEATIETLE